MGLKLTWKVTLNDEEPLWGEELLHWSLSLGATNEFSHLETRWKELVFSEGDVLKTYIDDELAFEGEIDKLRRRTKDYMAYASDKLALLKDKYAKDVAYSEFFSWKAGLILKELLSHYLPNVYNVVNVDDGPTLDHVNFLNQALFRCAQELCDRSKYDFWLEPPNKVFFKPRASLSSGQVVVYGDEIVSLDLSQDYLGEKTLAIIRGRGGIVATAGTGDKEILFYDEDVSTQSEANELANAILELFSISETMFEGSMRLKTLNPKIRAGRTILVRAKERYALDDASMRVASATLDPWGTNLQIGIVRRWLRRRQRKALGDALRQQVDKIIVQQGTIAQRPSPNLLGRLYYATDEKIMYRDTGTAWEEKVRGESATRLAELSEKDFTSMEGYLGFAQAEDPFARYSFWKERRFVSPGESEDKYNSSTTGSGTYEIQKDLFRVRSGAATSSGAYIKTYGEGHRPLMNRDPWFKCRAYFNPASGRHSWVGIGNTSWFPLGGEYPSLGFFLNGTTLYAYAGVGGNVTTISIATGVSAGWYLLEARVSENGTKIKYYLDGVYKTEITSEQTMPGPNDELSRSMNIMIRNTTQSGDGALTIIGFLASEDWV